MLKVSGSRIVLIVLTVFALALSSVLAQESDLPELQGIQLVDTPVIEELVISVPEGWLVFNRGDYATEEEALAGLQDVFDSVLPGGGQVTPRMLNLVDFSAMRPEPLAEGGLVQVIVTLLPLEEIGGALGVAADEVTPETLAAALNMPVEWESIDINERPAAAGLQIGVPLIYRVVYVFPEQELGAVVQVPMSEAYNQALQGVPEALVMTLRLEGEPVDIEAYDDLTEALRGSALEFPELVALPEESGEATPEATATEQAG